MVTNLAVAGNTAARNCILSKEPCKKKTLCKDVYPTLELLDDALKSWSLEWKMGPDDSARILRELSDQLHFDWEDRLFFGASVAVLFRSRDFRMLRSFTTPWIRERHAHFFPVTQ